jgi:hypothetical protein
VDRLIALGASANARSANAPRGTEVALEKGRPRARTADRYYRVLAPPLTCPFSAAMSAISQASSILPSRR